MGCVCPSLVVSACLPSFAAAEEKSDTFLAHSRVVDMTGGQDQGRLYTNDREGETTRSQMLKLHFIVPHVYGFSVPGCHLALKLCSPHEDTGPMNSSKPLDNVHAKGVGINASRYEQAMETFKGEDRVVWAIGTLWSKRWENGSANQI